MEKQSIFLKEDIFWKIKLYSFYRCCPWFVRSKCALAKNTTKARFAAFAEHFFFANFVQYTIEKTKAKRRLLQSP